MSPVPVFAPRSRCPLPSALRLRCAPTPCALSRPRTSCRAQPQLPAQPLSSARAQLPLSTCRVCPSRLRLAMPPRTFHIPFGCTTRRWAAGFAPPHLLKSLSSCKARSRTAVWTLVCAMSSTSTNPCPFKPSPLPGSTRYSATQSPVLRSSCVFLPLSARRAVYFLGTRYRELTQLPTG